MTDIDKKLDEILSKIVIGVNQVNKSDRTVEVWDEGEIIPLKLAIKKLITDEFEKMAEIDDRLNNVMARIAYSDGYEDGKSSKTR